MTPVKKHTGRAVVLPIDNIDTDQILPARFLKKPRSAGYGNFLFHDLRQTGTGEPHFPLDVEGELPSIIIAGNNFGCGSSREGAVYALVDGGIRAVVSSRVADIFRNNAVRNSLVPVELGSGQMEELLARLTHNPMAPVTIDLEAMVVRLGDEAFPFQMDHASRRRLLLGLDDIAETTELLPAIEVAETTYRQRRPWL